MTKNQVVGLCARNGLSDPANSPIKRDGTRDKPRAKRLPETKRKIVPKPRHELTEGKRRCLWPKVDTKRDKAECGKQAIKYDGREYPYCLAHCRRAYQGFGG